MLLTAKKKAEAQKFVEDNLVPFRIKDKAIFFDFMWTHHQSHFEEPFCREKYYRGYEQEYIEHVIHHFIEGKGVTEIPLTFCVERFVGASRPEANEHTVALRERAVESTAKLKSHPDKTAESIHIIDSEQKLSTETEDVSFVIKPVFDESEYEIQRDTVDSQIFHVNFIDYEEYDKILSREVLFSKDDAFMDSTLSVSMSHAIHQLYMDSPSGLSSYDTYTDAQLRSPHSVRSMCTPDIWRAAKEKSGYVGPHNTSTIPLSGDKGASEDIRIFYATKAILNWEFWQSLKHAKRCGQCNTLLNSLDKPKATFCGQVDCQRERDKHRKREARK